MNKIKNLQALESLRNHLPDKPLPPPESALQSAPAEEAKIYGEAFDALLTLWQVIGSMPMASLPPAVKQAQIAASMRLVPLFSDAYRTAS